MQAQTIIWFSFRVTISSPIGDIAAWNTRGTERSSHAYSITSLAFRLFCPVRSSEPSAPKNFELT